MLGLIEGRIRFLDELGDGVVLIRHQGRHPEAATDPPRDPGFVVGNAEGSQRGTHLLGDLHGPLQGGAGQQQGELLSAVTGSEIVFPPQHFGQQARHLLQALVPHLMTIVIIELLEVVHIHQHQRKRRPGTVAATPGARQGVVEMGPVGDAGQTVEAGRELEVLGDRLQLGHQIRIGKTVVERGHLIPPPTPQLKADMKKVGDTMLKEWLEKAGPEGQALVDAFRK